MSVTFYLEHHALKVTIGVGVAIGEVKVIIIVEDCVVPAESEIWLVICTTFAIAILVVFSVLTTTVPTHVSLLTLPL